MNAPDPTPRPPAGRALVIVCGLALALALGLLTRSWNAPILDRYEFRQLQTALSTYWIAQEGWRLDYPTPLFGPPWSVPMEFPTYQTVVAAWHRLTGLPLEQSGRLVSIGFLLATLPALYDLLALAGLPRSRRLIVLAVVMTSPVHLFYGRSFMIETAALCFATGFLAVFRRTLERPRWTWIAATTGLATLAALTKITTFLVFGPPAVALAIAGWRRARQSDENGARPGGVVFASAVPALLSLGAAWAWTRHADAVKHSNPFTGFLASTELTQWNFGELALRWDSSFWIRLQETVSGHVLADGALAVALLCTPFAPPRARRIAGAALAGFAAGPLVFANLYHIHDYYYAANALLLLAAAGLMVASVWDDARFPRGANWLALAIVLTTQLYAFYRGYDTHHRRPAPTPPALAEVIRRTVPAEGVVLIYGADWNPLVPYYSQRRTLMVPGEREHELDVLAAVLARLPPRRIEAMVVHGDRLRGQPAFIAERTAHFGLSAQPAARDGAYELYLPASDNR